MNDNVSSAQKLLHAIEWVHEVYEGTGRNGLEEGARLSGEISDTLAPVNSTLSEGWANIASTVLKFNDSAESFMEDLYSELVRYCNNVIAAESDEAKAVNQTKEASEDAVQQVDSLFN